MRHFALLLAILLVACGGPDPRKAVVSPMPGVDLAALDEAVSGLREATGGDTDLEVGSCGGPRYCIVVVVGKPQDCPEGERCYGFTNEPGAEGVIIHVDPVIGNNAATMAHELLHAVGIGDHTSGHWDELMNDERPLGQAERVFGERTAGLYLDAFGVDVKGGARFNAVGRCDGEQANPEAP